MQFACTAFYAISNSIIARYTLHGLEREKTPISAIRHIRHIRRRAPRVCVRVHILKKREKTRKTEQIEGKRSK